MEAPCSQLINRGTGLSRAGANSFPCRPAVHCCVQGSDLGLRRKEPGSNNPGLMLHLLHSFPGAFVTKNHRVGGLEQQKTSQKFLALEAGSSKLKWQQGYVLSQTYRRRIPPGLFQPLVALNSPWLVASSLQSLTPPPFTYIILVSSYRPLSVSFCVQISPS